MDSFLISLILSENTQKSLWHCFSFLPQLLFLELIMYKSNLNRKNVEDLMVSVKKMISLRVFRLNIARCELNDYSLISVLEFLSLAKNLEEVELQIYGNQFSIEVLIVLIDCIQEMKLIRFFLSAFDFLNQENDPKYSVLVQKFEALKIIDKKLS